MTKRKVQPKPGQPQQNNPKTSNRRDFLQSGLKSGLVLGAGGAVTAGLSTPAIAQGAKQWRMVTSWPKKSPGPGISAERVANRITTMSNGRLTVKVYGAGELVPPLGVFDAVSQGNAEMAHTASFFWRGKSPLTAFFTTVPFGLDSREHMAWIYHGGGQQLWDTLYGRFGIKPFMAGNTGMQMGGWFKKEINSLEDLKGLKMRIAGLGGVIMRKLGVNSVLVPPGEIFGALNSGVVDGAEFLGPWIDEAFGFYKAASYYYQPGYMKPNGSGEALVSKKAYDALPADLQMIVEEACRAEHAQALAEADWRNAAALTRLVEKRGVKLRSFAPEIIAAVKKEAGPAVASLAGSDALGKEMLASYSEALKRARLWSKAGLGAYLAARDG